jgi:hypothetical protein
MDWDWNRNWGEEECIYSFTSRDYAHAHLFPVVYFIMII